MPSRPFLTVALLLTLALPTPGCAGNTSVPEPSCLGTQPPPAQLGHAAHVYIVTIDGLNPELVDPEIMPHLARMARDGASSVGAITVSVSLTLPAHASMITGLPPDRHGVLWNKRRPDLGPLEPTTIFELAAAAGIRTGLFSGKDKLWHLFKPGSIDDGSASKRPDAEVMDEALGAIVEHRTGLALIHLPDVDNAGHRWGWNSEAQADAAREADAALGRLVATLDKLGMRDDTVVIVTADHGGSGRTHGDGEADDLSIPWIVWGDGVEARELPPVCVTATAPTALRLLGLDVPSGW